MTDFVHLHVHSEYSLLDGAARIPDLVLQAKANGQKALALTDHGCMYGVVDFYKECIKQDIKPLIGIETYVAPRNLDDKQGKMDKEYAHLILIAKNKTGYHNLMQLSSMAFVKGFYYRPRIDYTMLEEYSEGLIVCSACLAGDLPRLLLDGRLEDAIEYVQNMKRIFKDDYYIEIQDHGIPEQRQILGDLVKVAKICDVKIIASNDVHYVKKEDAEAQDALMCIQTNRFMDETNRMKMFGSEFYLKSTEEMIRLFQDYPEAIVNTNEIADKCDVQFEFGNIHLPEYTIPEEYQSHTEYLRALCESGLQKRYTAINQEIQERLEYELLTIENMGYVDYFLIVWDFINYAREQDIMVGPGRGSAAGSIVAYCLGITDVDPIRYGLLFERFLNPERISMPDIDIDFCYERRQEVIEYVQRKYGEDHVSQIITFGTMGARQAIRDVGRVLRVPYSDVDKLSKMIPFELGITLDKAWQKSKELQQACENDADLMKVFELARKIEGLPRHASTHAAGVVISAKPMTEYVPLQTNDGAITTQFPMGTIEELGLLKMDFLGLRTLTVIRDTIAEIQRQGKEVPNFDEMGYDDPNVYAMISSGETDGLFQLESSGMRAFLQQLQPNCFEDIIAGISLYRPGPMDQIPMYVERKFHPEKVQYDHPMLEPILSMTYGCMVYQEQVMQIVRDLAGYSMGHSDLVRRAMSKKKKDVMEKEEDAFIAGCAKNNIPEKTAKKIFSSMMDFAQYAFNKSHAAAYAVIAYRTAWLKFYYRAEFFASSINSFLNVTDKVSEYIQCCQRDNIPLLPPSINDSVARFSVTINQQGEKALRFGLAAIKNVGQSACDAIVQEREKNGDFVSFTDFIDRCAFFVNKRMVEYLIKAGAFDDFGQTRATLLQAHAVVLDGVLAAQKRNIAGQVSLFDMMGESSKEAAATEYYAQINEFPEFTRLQMEKEATGIYITGHPLREYQASLQTLNTSRDLLVADKEENSLLKDEQAIKMGGLVRHVKRKLTRKNDMMAYLEMEDMLGIYECVVFPNVLAQSQSFLHEDAILEVRGSVNVRDDSNVLIVRSIKELGSTNAEKEVKSGLYLRCSQEQVLDLLPLLEESSGECPIVFVHGSKAFTHEIVKQCAVSEGLLAQLCFLLGDDNVKHIA